MAKSRFGSTYTISNRENCRCLGTLHLDIRTQLTSLLSSLLQTTRAAMKRSPVRIVFRPIPQWFTLSPHSCPLLLAPRPAPPPTSSPPLLTPTTPIPRYINHSLIQLLYPLLIASLFACLQTRRLGFIEHISIVPVSKCLVRRLNF